MINKLQIFNNELDEKLSSYSNRLDTLLYLYYKDGCSVRSSSNDSLSSEELYDIYVCISGERNLLLDLSTKNEVSINGDDYLKLINSGIDYCDYLLGSFPVELLRQMWIDKILE